MGLNLTNSNELIREDFNKMVTINDFEVFSDQKVKVLQVNLDKIIEKSEKDELSEQDNDTSKILKAEIGSLLKFTIVNDDFSKSVLYVRPKQIGTKEDNIQKGELGEILDIKSGVYLDTELNRELGRVGKQLREVNEEKDE